MVKSGNTALVPISSHSAASSRSGTCRCWPPRITVIDDLVAGLLGLDGVEEIVGRLDRLAVDGHDQVGRGAVDVWYS